jgi:seryl-tRNA synthetase
MIKRFLHLFKEYRDMEHELNSYKKTFNVTRKDLIAMKQQINSDAALIKSLNRYIEALEGKAAYQADLIRESKLILKDLLSKPLYKNRYMRRKKKR